MIERYQLQAFVHLVGWASSDVVIAHLREARAMVLPSFAEGLPVVIMEALALERPVVVTAIAGTPELVDASCGWLIPAGSIDALVDAMKAAIEAPIDQLAEMGRTGRARVAAQHDALQNGRQLNMLFIAHPADAIDMLIWAVWLLAVPPIFVLLIFTAEALLGTLRLKPVAVSGPLPSTCILIPAHNEASIILDTLERLRPLLSNDIRLLVVADNCSDETARLVRQAGQPVIERLDPDKRGKGYALAFGREHLRSSPPDCVIVLTLIARPIPCRSPRWPNIVSAPSRSFRRAIS